MKSKVSVILTVMNEANTIGATLENLLSQSREPDEIVIVDGGSKDGTIDIINDYAHKHDIIRLKVAVGANIARGRNIAIRGARYPIIACTDAGCKPEKKWLEELVRPLEEDQTLEVVAGVIKVESYNDFEFYSGKLMAGGLKEPDEKDFILVGRSSAFKKTIWKKAGGYPEWLYTAEDTLFEKKLRYIGASIKLARDSVVRWRPRQNIWKMAKMFYLYGKGGGRIGENVSGAYYHIRNHIICIILIIISFFYPLTLLLLAILSVYFYMGFYRPILKRVKKVSPSWKTEFYVTVIVFIRTLSHCTGLIVGHYEYKYISGFREKFEAYMML